jgi:hypothetical protein
MNKEPAAVDGSTWSHAETPDEYLENCREGLEEYSERKFCKLMGWRRVDAWRAKQLANIPDGLFDRLLDLPRVPSIRDLAAIGAALNAGEVSEKAERCPHCGGVLRVRLPFSAKLLEVVNKWLSEPR